MRAGLGWRDAPPGDAPPDGAGTVAREGRGAEAGGATAGPATAAPTRRGRRGGRCGERHGAPRLRATAAAKAGELLDQRGIGHVRALDLAGDHALLQQQHAIGELGDEVEILLHHHDGDAAIPVERPQELDDRVDDGRLDAFRGLVEED